MWRHNNVRWNKNKVLIDPKFHKTLLEKTWTNSRESIQDKIDLVLYVEKRECNYYILWINIYILVMWAWEHQHHF